VVDEIWAAHTSVAGLTPLGRPEGFISRQIAGWSDRWNRSKTEELTEMVEVMRWLAESIPESGPPTLVHNDYKLDNVMLDARDPGRVEAVLDWEMATVGDPLADLGLTLCYWTLGSASAGERASISAGAGWFSRDELVERYRRARDFVTASYWEGFCLPILEAFAAGTPVVGRRAYAIPELVEPSRCGILFDSNTDIENALEASLQLPPKVYSAARTFALGYSWQNSVDQLRRQYLNVLGASQA